MTTTNESATQSNSPTHIVYHIRGKGDKAFWTRIGAAWAHKDGSGFNAQIDIVPLDGNITVRIASEKKK